MRLPERLTAGRIPTNPPLRAVVAMIVTALFLSSAPVRLASAAVPDSDGSPARLPSTRTASAELPFEPVFDDSEVDEIAFSRSLPAGSGHAAVRSDACRCWQVMPQGLIYHSYLAGAKEPRFAGQWVKERDTGAWVWDIALGGRVGILRYGTVGPHLPQGWQIDMEGAAFPRLDLDHDRDLISCDYRFGVPLTWGYGKYQMKFAYYHLSSHLGDEYMLRHPGEFRRINYSRDVLVWGHSYYLLDDLRVYGEIGGAVYNTGGAEPWELQFGVEYAPTTGTGFRGAPFFAVGGHLREELDYGGNVVVQTGWAWRGNTGGLFRVGMQYYAGYDDQFEFYDRYVDKLGFGIWYDY